LSSHWTRPLWLLLLLAVLPTGCLRPEEPSDGDAARLADYAGCPWTYPDGKPVDCDRDEAEEAGDLLPSGYTCVDQAPPPGISTQATARLWHSEDDHYIVDYVVPSEPGQFTGIAKIDLGEPDQVAFKGGPSGFVALPSPLPGTSGSWEVKVFRFSAEGTPQVLGTDSLEVATTLHEGSGWFVWNFSNGTGTYSFQSMDRLEVGDSTYWVPASFRTAGQDFDLNATAHRAISAGGDFTVPTSLDEILNQPRCSA
jgi:hypothetical protein